MIWRELSILLLFFGTGLLSYLIMMGVFLIFNLEITPYAESIMQVVSLLLATFISILDWIKLHKEK